jgi:hypothetical protein
MTVDRREVIALEKLCAAFDAGGSRYRFQ